MEKGRADDVQALAYFQAVREAFDAGAQAAGEPLEHFFRIAGYSVRVRFAGPALIPRMTPALQHLHEGPTPSPALTICAWDSASTGAKLPPTPWSSHYSVRGEIQGYNTDRFHTVLQHESSALSMYDRAQDAAVFWVPDASQIPYWETGAPFRTLLHWWMANHARQLVHAAAVGTPQGGLLLVGKGGSGKSTTALACLESELLYAGDDYVVVGAEPSPYIYSLYNSAKLNADHIHRFPQLLPKVSNPERLEEEKALLFVKANLPHKVATGFPAKAIFVPRVTGQPETRLRPSSGAAVLAAMAPSTIFQLPRAGHEAFQFLAEFVKQLPCFVLECGTDIPRIPGVIQDFLSRR